ncbi:MAG: ATP-binding protein [Thermodesulfobacteriota bacterium]
MPASISADLTADFIQEGLTLVDDALELVQPDGCPAASVNGLFRCLHTLKGTSAILELVALSEFVHRFEDFVRDRQGKGEGLTPAEAEVTRQGLFLLQEAVGAAGTEPLMVERPPFRDFLQALQQLKVEQASMACLDGLLGQLRQSLAAVSGVGAQASLLVPIIEATEAALGKIRSTRARVVLPVDHLAVEAVTLAGEDVTALVCRQLAALEQVAQHGKTAFASLDVHALNGDVAGLKALLAEGDFLLDWDVILDLCDISPEVVSEAVKRLWEEGVLREGQVTMRSGTLVAQAAAGPAAPAEMSPAEAGGALPAAEPAGGRGEHDPEFFRVSGRILDEIAAGVGSLVADRNALENLVSELGSLIPPRYRRLLQDSSGDLDRHVNSLERRVTSLTSRRLSELYQRLPALIKQLSEACGKSVLLETTGGEIEVPRSFLKILGDPLVHLVRNAVDHGFESPRDRLAAGKDQQGLLAIWARREDERLILTVADDGRGLDCAAIRRKAVERGLIPAAADLDDAAIRALIFAPGFSTAEAVTKVSGRGVGMDVVRAAIEGSGGRIQIESEPGRGTTFELVVPVISGNRTRDILLVQVGSQVFGVDYRCLVEVLDASQRVLHGHRDRRFFAWRGQLLPFVDLAVHLGEVAAGGGGDGLAAIRILVVEDEYGRRLACGVQGIQHKVKVVVTPFGHGLLKAHPILSGTAVVGTGEPRLVLEFRDVSLFLAP